MSRAQQDRYYRLYRKWDKLYYNSLNKIEQGNYRRLTRRQSLKLRKLCRNKIRYAGLLLRSLQDR